MKVENEEIKYLVFKGLQAPLVFKGFKGKFIYIAAAALILGFFISAFLINTYSMAIGIIALFVIWGGSFFIMAMMQKKGLHFKDSKKGIFIVINKYHIKKLEEHHEEELI